MKKFLRDLALTLYDHPTEFKCLSLARLWMTLFGICMLISWGMETFAGTKFSAWVGLNAAFATAAGAYGLKKWQEGNNKGGDPP